MTTMAKTTDANARSSGRPSTIGNQVRRPAVVNARRALELSGALAARTFAPEAVRIAHASSHNGER